MPYDKDLILNDGSTAVTADGQGTGILVGPTVNDLTIEVICTAKSGTTPTMDLTIQGSMDNSTYYDLVKFAQYNAVGTYRRKVPPNPYLYLRCSYDVGGTTPSFTQKVFITVGGVDKGVG